MRRFSQRNHARIADDAPKRVELRFTTYRSRIACRAGNERICLCIAGRCIDAKCEAQREHAATNGVSETPHEPARRPCAVAGAKQNRMHPPCPGARSRR